MTRPLDHGELVAASAAGLEGTIVANTILSDVDGASGNLVLRGRRIEDLAGKLSFETAVEHLWGKQVRRTDMSLKHAFGRARVAAFEATSAMGNAPAALDIYDRMRLGLCAVPNTLDVSEAERISGALPVLLAAATRIKSGQSPITPDPALSVAEDLYRMTTGETPSGDAVRTLDRYLVTILDHGLNASTFTARVIASTHADMQDAVVGAMSALKGPLHGGAPGPVLDMLDAVGTPENADAWITAELGRGSRLMGFGHRVYRTRDPRADVLKQGLAALPRDNPKIALAEAVEKAALSALARTKPNRALDTNVEFYTAVLLDAIGIDRSLFTPLFATGRTPGWCAHVVEQQQTGKLIRPGSTYVGPVAD